MTLLSLTCFPAMGVPGFLLKRRSGFNAGLTTLVYIGAIPGDEQGRIRGNEHSEWRVNPNQRKPTMGDKSPKSTQKKASQKQSKNDDASKKKQQLITSQQATKAKVAANKKK